MSIVQKYISNGLVHIHRSCNILQSQQTSTAMASPSSAPSVPVYHVFISFRGDDTRKNFVDHLYKALSRQGISTYKDDITLAKGELIKPSLMKAIKGSRIAVVVFSTNFANSSWCLDELSCILKCRDTRGLIVMPVFYKVDPSMVRKQALKYEEPFFKHKLKNKKKAKSRRKALVLASKIAGWVTEQTHNGHEATCIEEIVDEISKRLHQKPRSTVSTLSVDDNLIGIKTRLDLLRRNLEIGIGGVRMIGIWGIGGGGKTTLAKFLYNEISGMFDSCCFVNNIREESSKHNGLEKLQKELLSGLFKEKQGRPQNVDEGRFVIRDRICRRKVLIVLDDVDRLDQLEAFAGSVDWFGEGNRIIITSRNKHLLVAHRVNVIHKVSLLNDNEAMELFCKHAFLYGGPIEDYQLLSKVVSYAGGLPLALAVLGSFLCGKGIDEWRSALARLKEFPDANILEKLKISFDALEPVEKRLFLDIASFVKGEHTHEGAMMMLDDGRFHNGRGIKALIGMGSYLSRMENLLCIIWYKKWHTTSTERHKVKRRTVM